MNMRHFFFGLLCLLLTACAHTAMKGEENRVRLLSLGALHPLPSHLPLSPEELPGNDNAARAALFHNSDLSPASFAWRILHRIPDFRHTPQHEEFLARILLCQEETEAALHVADTRIHNLATRFRIYRLAYNQFQSLGMEKEAHLLLLRLDRSFTRKQKQSPAVQEQWLELYLLENQYPLAKKHFLLLEKQLSPQIPTFALKSEFFHKIRRFGLMAHARGDVQAVERSARLLERIVASRDTQPFFSEREIHENLEHTYIFGKGGKTQNSTSQAVIQIALLRFYGQTGAPPDKILALYKQLLLSWERALEARSSGKSFEALLPTIAEILYSAGFKEEAFEISARIPAVFPFTVHPDPGLSDQNLAVLRTRQRLYNFRRPAQIQKNLASRLISLMGPKESEEDILNFIEDFPDPDHRPTLLIRALQSRIREGQKAPLLWEEYHVLESTASPPVRPTEVRRLITALLQGQNPAHARQIMESLRMELRRKPWKEQSPWEMGELAAAFTDFLPEVANELMTEAMDIFEAMDMDPDKAASCIQHLGILCRRFNDPTLHQRILQLHARAQQRLIRSQISLLPSDREYETRFHLLIRMIRLRLSFGIRDDQTRVLLRENEAISDKIVNPMLQKNLKLLIAQLYIQAGWFREAYEALRHVSIEEGLDTELMLRIRQDVLLYDAFPGQGVARFDTDGDGHPDFFSPLASESQILQSGLTLDADSDGDGIPDTEDLRPWFKDSLHPDVSGPPHGSSLENSDAK